MKNTLNFSPKESDRFKMNIYRGEFESANANEIKNQIIENSVDIAIIRIKSDQTNELNKIERLGFPYIQADTLAYYFVDFNNYVPKDYLNKNLEFNKITKKDSELLKKLTFEIFKGYSNHYNSNPYLEKQRILDGYFEWVESFLDSENDNKKCYLIKINSEIAGFASLSIDNNIGEGVLYGILPSFSGQGLYTDLIRFTQNKLVTLGVSQMKVSTQIQNYAVQKVWTREGFNLKEAYNTYHVNPMLNYSILPKVILPITITNNEIQEFGRISGDTNPLHFNDEFAQKLGFESRIAHGIILSSIISKYYGTNFPGNGTIFKHYKYSFLAPIYPDKKYNLTVSIIKHIENKGYFESLAKIYDDKGRLCIISYNQLKK